MAGDTEDSRAATEKPPDNEQLSAREHSGMLANKIENAVERVMEIPKSVQGKVVEQVYRLSGISVDELTCNFVDTRLRRRLRALSIDEPEAYLSYLNEHHGEVEHLINAFTTNETSFFRTVSLWTYLENTLLPELAARPPGRTPALWSAACSSGEEAYSLAMLCAQIFATANNNVLPRIYATDISTEALKKAREGTYSGRTIKRLKASRNEMLTKHFVQEGEDYQLREALRKQVQFSSHNLMEETGKRGTYDLVLLRNVLIYFKPTDQVKIVRNIVSSMNAGGVLAIGESESLAFCDSGLEFVKPFVYRKPEHE